MTQTANQPKPEFRDPVARDAAHGRFLRRRGGCAVVVKPRTYNDLRPMPNNERRAAWAARYYLTQQS